MFARHFNAGCQLVSGRSIETHPHPFLLEKSQSLEQTGWAPEDVRLNPLDEVLDTAVILSDLEIQESFARKEAVRHARGERGLNETENGIKFAVIGASSPFLERSESPFSCGPRTIAQL